MEDAIAVGTEELPVISSVAPDSTAEAVAVHELGRFGPVALDSVRSDAPNAAKGRRQRGAGGSWERYVTEMYRRLEEVEAMLSFAERGLSHDRRASRVLELATPRGIVSSLDPEGDQSAPGERSVGERTQASIRLLRERWSSAVRTMKDLGDAGQCSHSPVLEALGCERGLVRLGRDTIPLGRRHTEILVLLASHPRGMNTEQIALALYGDAGRPGTIRTALCRLRKILGPWISNERSQVTVAIDADFLEVQRLLRAGLVREAAHRYPAALLPASEAPGVADAREELDAWVRSAILTSGDQEALWAWLASASGCDDALAWRRFLAGLEFRDPRRPLAVSRLAQLRRAGDE